MKGLVIGGTHSGCGKTTVSLGLIAALRRRGLSVSSFKVGPDFIDPGHHTQVTGNRSRNLDGWMLSREVNREIFHRHAAHTDIAVVEGVMGLFDGYDGNTEAGSTAQMAKWLNLSMVLVVDARSMARSAAALVRGFEHFDPELHFTGVIFNQVGSPMHLKYLKDALASSASMPCLGGMMRSGDVIIPERYLGLVTADDHATTSQNMNNLADWMENAVDLDALLNALPEIASVPFAGLPHAASKVRIAVARDKAFCFYYPENLEMLEESGAEIIRFSPLKDAGLPENIDGIYLGGGYPELHAAAIAANAHLKHQILENCGKGMPIYGECGGFMVLCKTLVDLDGREHPMAGCFDFTCRMSSGFRALGYREITLIRSTILGAAGVSIRGHEFHYSHLDPHDRKTVYQALNRDRSAGNVPGFQVNRCLGSYLHLHFRSRPSVPRSFVNACLEYQSERIRIHAAS